jgi:acyl-coenzyme A thioesterase PaaI-like protein
MTYRIQSKQPNSKMCLVCGLKNPYGLKSSFFELENGELLAIFKPEEMHQGYPGRLHGGIAAAVLDETIGRVMLMRDPQVWGVTMSLATKFRKPVPLDGELRVIGRIDTDARRYFEGTGELILPDGSVAVEGYGKYYKIPLDKITDFDFEEQEWTVTPCPDDPVEYVP